MGSELILMGLALTAVAADGWMESLERTYRQQKVQERPYYSGDTIYRLYYLDSGLPRDVVLSAWGDVARILHVEGGRLRPGDRLVGVLGFHSRLRSSRSDIDRLLKFVRQRLETRHHAIPSRIYTVDDVVRCLAASEMSRYYPALAPVC